MAYKGYEFRNAAGTRAGFFAALEAFLVAIGWELHDTVSATVKVYKSNGESGNEPYGYIWIDAGTSTYIQFQAFQYWDDATNVGTRPQYAFNAASCQISSTYCADATYRCIFAGDKNFVLIVNRPTANAVSSGLCFGHIPGRFDPSLAKAMGTAGTPGTLLVSSSANMGVGKTIQICGATTEGCDKLVVSSVPSATGVLVTALPRNYGTGAVIGAPASVFGIVALGSSFGARFYPTSPWGDAGTAVTTTAYHGFLPLTGPAFNTLVVFHPQKYYSTPIFCVDVSATTPGAYLGMFYKDFLSFFASVTADDCMIANADESTSAVSTATGGGALVLNDTSKSWVDDSQIGKFIVVTGGVGIGQIRKITDNDATSLTIGYAWETNVNSTSEYKIADYIYRIAHTVALAVSTTGRLGILITETSVPA